jgi:ribose-phosphate pyrophosphokinase
LHAGQIQGFFDLPVDNLYGKKVFSPENCELALEMKNNPKDFVVVSPDAGGVGRARALAKQFGSSVALIDKRRDVPGQSKVMHVIGNVKGKKALLFDDMVDTGGTLVNAAEALTEEGALEVYGLCIHAVLSGEAVAKINSSQIKKFYVTDTLPLKDEAKESKKFVVLSIAGLLAEAIRRIYEDDSVSDMFEPSEK